MLKLVTDMKGFTLLEVVVAMAITLVGLLGMLTAVQIAMQHNLKNQVRDDALQVAEETMNSLSARPFDNISAEYHSDLSIRSRVRGVTKNYTVARTGDYIGSSTTSRELKVTVSWGDYGRTQQLQLRSIKSQ